MHTQTQTHTYAHTSTHEVGVECVWTKTRVADTATMFMGAFACDATTAGQIRFRRTRPRGAIKDGRIIGAVCVVPRRR